MTEERFDRQLLLFGAEGQSRLHGTRAALVGVGGTGSHVAQQLAFLGVNDFALIDRDATDVTSLNRLIGAVPKDGTSSVTKVDVAERLIRSISPEADVKKVGKSFISEEGYAAIKEADYVFGCVDRDSARFILNELCQAFKRPYFDIATDVDKENARNFGGRLLFSTGGRRCLVCSNVLNEEDIRADLATDAERREYEEIYGVPLKALVGRGPSVVSLNGILASLAVTEFMVEVTGLRPAVEHLTYKGAFGVVSVNLDPPSADCFYCKGIRDEPALTDVERWISGGYGEKV